jgi:serine/threonine protein kinase
MYDVITILFFNIIFTKDLFKEHLGKGGQGDVFKVEKQSTKEMMAIKVIWLGKEGSNEYNTNMKNIESEISIGIKLGHHCKYLVKLIEFFIEGEYCCLVMELCNGGNLQEILDSKKKLTETVKFLIFFYLYHCFIFYL